MNCIKCGQPTDVDLDSYNPFHTRCMEAAVAEANERTSRVAAGDITLTNLSKEERELILQHRKDIRNALDPLLN